MTWLFLYICDSLSSRWRVGGFKIREFREFREIREIREFREVGLRCVERRSCGDNSLFFPYYHKI